MSELFGESGRYTIENEIGRGGMATVYKAHDSKHDRDVAVKVLRDDLVGVVGSDRFLREIDIAAHLQHPHILPLYDSGQTPDSLFYVMPLVEGETLRQRLEREKQLPVEDALTIIRQIGDAISHANSRGIVHRDLKPENILLGSGHAMVADFGIATAVAEADSEKLTDTGIVVGTAAYMSPEQAGNDNVDGRSDVYSLGCVLYEMLSGEPPFTGRTQQAILARVMSEPPRSLAVVRPNTPRGVVAAVERALSKVPADRFPTATRFLEALEAEPKPYDEPTTSTRHRNIIALMGVVTVALLAWLAWPVGASNLDSNTVIVFPLEARGFTGADSALGEDIGLLFEISLQHTDPLRWESGRNRLHPDERARIGTVSQTRLSQIAMERGARYFLHGTVLREGDDARIILRLQDALTDSTVAQETASGEARLATSIGLEALARLLPARIDPGRAIDLSPIAARDPAALALWIQGERSYRHARYAEALEFYDRAIELDSLLVFASFKGSQAASWENEFPEARQLIDVTLAHEELLPKAHLYFARGLKHYLVGRADSAIAWLKQTIALQPRWGEAHMALGDVYYHLIPSGIDLETQAEAHFEASAAADAGFAPPLGHLAELAMRRGDLERARELIQRFAEFNPEARWGQELSTMLGCLDGSKDRSAMDQLAATGPKVVLAAGQVLAGGARQPECAIRAYRAVLASNAERNTTKWGALKGLQGLLIASGRDEEAVAVIDSAYRSGLVAAMGLYFVGALSGADMQREASDAAALLMGWVNGELSRFSLAQSLWMMGAWYAANGDLENARAAYAELRSRSIRSRHEKLYADLLSPHVWLALGDTSRAIAELRSLVPTAPADTLQWISGEALSIERVLLARLLLTRGQYREAHDVAVTLDHQWPVFFPQQVPQSLVIRISAADRLGMNKLADGYRTRLAAMGRNDLVDF